MSWGAKRRRGLSWLSPGSTELGAVEGNSLAAGEGERGEASGVSSAVGPTRGGALPLTGLRLELKVVSIGTGANRRRGSVGSAMIGGRRQEMVFAVMAWYLGRRDGMG